MCNVKNSNLCTYCVQCTLYTYWINWKQHALHLCTFALIGRSNQMPVGRNRMVEMNRMVEGQSGKMMTGSGWRASQRKWTPMRPIERETGECQNTMSVECRNGRESHSLSWISPTRAVWGASANRVGRCVSRVPIHPFIFLIFIANYLISYLTAFSYWS